jgi:hypothetical protein
MARQPYLVNTSQKQLEVFSSYGGGMNTQVHPEKLKDEQSVLIENADIIQGGILQARGAYKQTNHCEVIHLNTMDNIMDENFTFDMLSAFTFNDLNTDALSVSNVDTDAYYKTFEQWSFEQITFDVLKDYKMNDLKTTGVLKPNTGNSQGMFRYHTEDGHMDIVAIKGKLYMVIDNSTYKKLSIVGMKSFQTTRTVEATQYRDKMYIATGSGLVMFDGNRAYAVTAYAPNGLEALYIGTNGYAKDPLNYLSDTTGASNMILGVTTNLRYALVNQEITLTAYVEHIQGDILEYQFEYRKVADADYTVVIDWTTSKTATLKFTSPADYAFRINLRKQGTTTVLSQYVLPKYTVSSTPSTKEEDDSINFDNLAACNRVFVHYDRLFLYGDTTYKDYLYISHLDKFDYFPRTNIIKLSDPLRGELQNVARYKNMLLCWTNGSIQMLTGTSPLDYVLQPVHTTLGTLHGKSVRIIKNYITFVGNDNGLYILKSFNYASDEKLNVERIDEPIRDDLTELLASSTKVLSTVTNNQYFLYIETDKQNYVYRYYYEYNVWVRDVIELSFRTLDTFDNVVTACATNNGTVYKLDPDTFVDGTNKRYIMKVKSKNFVFGLPHHRKKLKQYQLLTKLKPSSSLTVSIYADDKLLSVTPSGYDPTQSSDSQKLLIMSSGRFRYVTVDITVPVRDSIQLLGFGFIFKQNTPK